MSATKMDGQQENGELHLACQNGDEAAVKRLLDADAKDVNLRGVNGMSGLHFAAQKGHVEIIQVRPDFKKCRTF